jgi:hypothetical protein
VACEQIVRGLANLPSSGAGGNSIDESFQITLGKKTIAIACKLTTDEKTFELTSESIKVGETEIKKDSPWVFLVDLSQEKVTYKPVKGAQADEVPDLKDRKTWPKTILRAIEQLRKKSPAVKQFLE